MARLRRRETAARRSPLLAMCAEGVLLSDVDGLGTALRAEARRRLAAGPPPVPAAELDELRYALTDALDNLRGCTDPHERAYLVAGLLLRASELTLLAGGHWLGTGAWLSRRLAAAAAGTPGGTDRFTAAVDDVLGRAGGPLFDGYRRSG